MTKQAKGPQFFPFSVEVKNYVQSSQVKNYALKLKTLIEILQKVLLKYLIKKFYIEFAKTSGGKYCVCPKKPLIFACFCGLPPAYKWRIRSSYIEHGKT